MVRIDLPSIRNLSNVRASSLLMLSLLLVPIEHPNTASTAETGDMAVFFTPLRPALSLHSAFGGILVAVDPRPDPAMKKVCPRVGDKRTQTPQQRQSSGPRRCTTPHHHAAHFHLRPLGGSGWTGVRRRQCQMLHFYDEQEAARLCSNQDRDALQYATSSEIMRLEAS